MAIDVEIIESKGTVRESGRNAQAFTVPFEAVTRATATTPGSSKQLASTTELFVVRNKGDAIWMRVGLRANDAVGGHEAGDNNKSIRMATGDEITCGLDPDIDASLYGVRIG